jgi:hypothetical protein
MTLLISLADFADYTAFSTNISAALVEPYIRDAQRFDVWPLLPANLRTELETARAQWLPATEKLFTDYVRPLLVLESACRMIVWHGTHVTPAGLEDLASDLNRTAASTTRRAVLSADLQAKAATYRALLIAALPSPSGACGSSTTRRPGRGGTTFLAA